MPPAETLLRRPLERTAVNGRQATVRGWGGGDGAPVTLLAPRDLDALRTLVTSGEAGRGAIARGMGRSYGDAAQLKHGVVIEMTKLKRTQLDAAQGTLTAQAGVSIGELLDELAPWGWVVPVVPGTQHVTVGGAIASDIHGKNHGTAGTFGSHVQALGLLSAAGEVLELEPGSADGLFEATLGGMGLTGVILWARIALRRVASSLLAVDTDRAKGLDEALSLLSAPGGPHRVAWLDLLGPRSGRGIVTRAEHTDSTDARRGPAQRPTVAARATVPQRWPGGMLRPSTVGLFNELRYRLAPRLERGRIESFGSHMFPLDSLSAWPRLYGRRGFVQYQLVVPTDRDPTLRAVIECLARARVPCYLAVLKDFGDANPAPLSFPIRGWTLALDLPRSAPGLERALMRCDELVAEAGGRVYLAKDSRLRADTVRAMYPQLDAWRAVRDSVDPDGLWRSDLALRTGLVPAVTPMSTATAGVTGKAARRVLLVGGSSEIGLAIVRRMAADGPVAPYLIGRDEGRLTEALAALDRAGCTGGEVEVLDADDIDSHEAAIGRAFERAGAADVVILAVGVLGAQAGLDADADEAIEVMRVNFVGSGSLLLQCLRRLRGQGRGTLVVLSSVAAERARAGNAIYGAAKAGLDALAQGLADATAGSGVRVLVVRPGFVKGRMTAGLKPAPLATTPEAVADATVRALAGRAHTVWVPPTLRPMFAVLRHLPRPIYRRLPL